MTQKYKVFIDNVQLFFVTEEIEGVQILLGNYFPESFAQLLDSFSELKEQQIQLVSKNPKRSLKHFFRTFNHIKAAGGLAQHKGQSELQQRPPGWLVDLGWQLRWKRRTTMAGLQMVLTLITAQKRT